MSARAGIGAGQARQAGREIGWARLVAYALPGLPLAALTLPLYVYLPTHYAREVGLPLALVGQILLAVRVLDAVSDPLVGWLSDRVPGRFGRRRTLFALSLPATALAAFHLMTPGATADAAYLLVWGCLLSLGTTLAILPYSAWGAELSASYAGRSRVVAAREAAIVAGTLIASAMPALLPLVGGGPQDALPALGLLVAASLPALGLAALLAVPEPRDYGRGRIRLRAGLRAMAANQPFLRLAAAFFANAMASALPASLFLFFVSERLGREDLQGSLLFLYFLCGIAGVPLWLAAAARAPKHRVWCASMALASAAFVWVPLIGPGDIAAFTAICVITGLAVGADLVLPNSIQADVVDVDTARTGEQRTGFYFAIWGLVNKLALAGAVGAAFPILGLLGFDAQAGRSSASGLAALAVLYALVPVGLKLAALALMWNFPLDGPAQAALRARIEADQPPGVPDSRLDHPVARETSGK